MKKILIFLFFFLIFSTQNVSSQECGFVNPGTPTFTKSTVTGCLDPTAPLPNYNGNVTFNLKLRILRNTDGSGGMTAAEENGAISDILLAYNAHGINFQVTVDEIWNSIMYNDIYAENINSVDFLEIETNYTSCIVGILSDKSYGNVGGDANVGGLGGGKFWARHMIDQNAKTTSSVTHELGHALGLYHTFQSGEGLAQITKEKVTRTGSTECPCNCLTEGDMVCDTPADPTTPNGSPPIYVIGETTCLFDNVLNLIDECNEVYVDFKIENGNYT